MFFLLFDSQLHKWIVTIEDERKTNLYICAHKLNFKKKKQNIHRFFFSVCVRVSVSIKWKPVGCARARYKGGNVQKFINKHGTEIAQSNKIKIYLSFGSAFFLIFFSLPEEKARISLIDDLSANRLLTLFICVYVCACL